MSKLVPTTVTSLSAAEVVAGVIAIAHPEFRDELTSAARKRKLLTR